MFELEDIGRLAANIKVIGVGGGGTNAINNMVAANIFGVEFITVNTDSQHLEASLAPVKVQIGSALTKGLGAGSNPVIGRQAALEEKDSLASCMEGADMVFITAGMGGGTGTGAAPVIANIAKDMGLLTVAVVTRPFYYEGRKRALNAEDGIKELKKYVDTLIIIPNDRIHLVVEKGTPLLKSFSIANDVLRQAIQGISDVILIPGLINLDFADVKSIMEHSGRAVIGMGSVSGEGGAFEAAKKAISNPLLEESSIEGARGILINITGGLDMSLDAVREAASLIHDSAHDEVHMILGTVIKPDMKDDVSVTVIATGLEDRVERVELSLKKWLPTKKPVSFKGSERILSKSIGETAGGHNQSEQTPLHINGTAAKSETAPEISPPEKPLEYQHKEPEGKPVIKESLFPDEEIYDIPTFLRKKTEE